MEKDAFARHFGFADYKTMLERAEITVELNSDVKWYVNGLRSGQWVAWADNDLDPSNVVTCDWLENAIGSWSSFRMTSGGKHRTPNEFVCEKLNIVRNPQLFYAKELGTCIPLASPESYHDEDEELLDNVVTFLLNNQSSLTVAYYQELLVPPQKPIERLPCHDREWIGHIKRLTGPDNVCFISNWNITPGEVSEVLPPSYRGQVVLRGNDPNIPALIEWTDELVKSSIHGARSAFGDVWGHGTWGYILPRQFIDKLVGWTKLRKVTSRQLEEFFSEIALLWWMKFEIDGILIMSHKFDSETICGMLREQGSSSLPVKG